MPGKALASKFDSLGTLKGKTKEEIMRVAGTPTSVSAMANGQLLQWLKAGYHISLLFDGSGICQGVSHEYRANGSSRSVEKQPSQSPPMKQPFQIPSIGVGGQPMFRGLTTFKGKTKEEIIAIVGQPNSVTELPDGRQLVQWVKAGLPFTLVFDSNGMYQGLDTGTPRQT
jgi:hypothetical protein